MFESTGKKEKKVLGTKCKQNLKLGNIQHQVLRLLSMHAKMIATACNPLQTKEKHVLRTTKEQTEPYLLSTRGNH